MTVARTARHNNKSPQPLGLKTWAQAFMLGSVLFTAGAAMSAHANNPSPTLRADAPNVYIVKKGDTLWDIAKHYLNSPWRWKEIWAVNPQVRNPHWIYPGDKLLMCTLNGHKIVGVDMGDGCAGIIRRATSQVTKVRIERTNMGIPVIPLGDIQNWLTAVTIVDGETLKRAPYVLAAKNKHIITAIGDVVYVRNVDNQPVLTIGKRYGVYREENHYIDPVTHQSLGHEMREVARGQLIAADANVSSLKLTESLQQEVREGDLVLPEQDNHYPALFYPEAAPSDLPASQVLNVMDAVSTGAAGSVIAINRGVSSGVQVGQVVAVNKQDARIYDPQRKDIVKMPNEREGLAMIFRSFKNISYAYVLEADEPVKTGDEVRAPVDR